MLPYHTMSDFQGSVRLDFLPAGRSVPRSAQRECFPRFGVLGFDRCRGDENQSVMNSKVP